MTDSKVENFNCTQNDSFIRWKYMGKDVVLSFDFMVFAEKVNDGSGVVVIEKSKINAPDNAVLYGPDGIEKLRIKNPLSNPVAFSDLYYVDDELTLISMAQIHTSACVIDADGQLVRVYETR